ncbi:MAG: PAS domain S-box protein, partial [Comamonadaceae bacterium]
MESEQEQSRLAARLSALLDSAMDGIITIDDSQRIILYNRAAERMFGWSAVQVLGRHLDMLIPKRFRAAHRDHVGTFAATGVTSRRMGGAVLLGLRAGGEEFPIEASISQLESPDGKLFTVILRDVRERVRAQEELAAFAAEATGVREQEKARIARELHDELA